MQSSSYLPPCLLFCWATWKSHAEKWKLFKIKVTRLHSSRMRTACALTVSPSILCARGVCFLGGLYLVLGGSASWGCTWSGGWCAWSWGVCFLGGCAWSWEGPARGGVSASWRGLLWGGTCLVPGGVPAQALPSVNRILDTCL